MIKEYSEKDHRGNELLKNSGKANASDSAVNQIQWGDLEDWTPTDGSGAGLTLTINSAKKTKIGKFVLVQFDITYPITVNGNNAKINGLPDTFVSACRLSLISITNIIGIKLRPFLSGTSINIQDSADTNQPNINLSNGRLVLTAIYLTASL